MTADELLEAVGCSWDELKPVGAWGLWMVEECPRHRVFAVVATPGSPDPYDTITRALERTR